MQDSGSKANRDASAVPSRSLDAYPAEIRDESFWLGEELSRREDWRLQLEPDQVDAIREARARVAGESQRAGSIRLI